MDNSDNPPFDLSQVTTIMNHLAMANKATFIAHLNVGFTEQHSIQLTQTAMVQFMGMVFSRSVPFGQEAQ